MKSTGIVRRIDDLGRVVIPKEIRHTLRIHEGDPVEIYLDGDACCFKRYSAAGLWGSTMETIVEMLNDEDVANCLTVEEKAVVRSTVALLSAKLKDKQ